MSELRRVTVDPDQCGGRPCIRGLRIRVKDVLDLLAAGASRDEIVADYPLLEPEDIQPRLNMPRARVTTRTCPWLDAFFGRCPVATSPAKRRLEGWPLARSRLWASFETRAPQSSSADCVNLSARPRSSGRG
jgi:uncharacterized protein (DUF433 family)